MGSAWPALNQTYTKPLVKNAIDLGVIRFYPLLKIMSVEVMIRHLTVTIKSNIKMLPKNPANSKRGRTQVYLLDSIYSEKGFTMRIASTYTREDGWNWKCKKILLWITSTEMIPNWTVDSSIEASSYRTKLFSNPGFIPEWECLFLKSASVSGFKKWRPRFLLAYFEDVPDTILVGWTVNFNRPIYRNILFCHSRLTGIGSMIKLGDWM